MLHILKHKHQQTYNSVLTFQQATASEKEEVTNPLNHGLLNNLDIRTIFPNIRMAFSYHFDGKNRFFISKYLPVLITKTIFV